MDLAQNKVVIVTGGTRGIGFSIALRFLEEGAKVAICGSRQETVDAALEKFKGIEADYQVMGICPKLDDPESVSKEFKKVVAEYGRIDVLCNNAGMSSRTPVADYTKEEWDKVINLNVNSVFFCSQEVVKIFREQGDGGCIINTSSMVGRDGQPSGLAYPTSKFAVNGLTLSLARELAKENIRVNAVAPGVTRTDMVDALPDEVIQPLIKTIPLGRIGEPEDIANAFVFLASDMASYISGAVLPVDGLSRT